MCSTLCVYARDDCCTSPLRTPVLDPSFRTQCTERVRYLLIRQTQRQSLMRSSFRSYICEMRSPPFGSVPCLAASAWHPLPRPVWSISIVLQAKKSTQRPINHIQYETGRMLIDSHLSRATSAIAAASAILRVNATRSANAAPCECGDPGRFAGLDSGHWSWSWTCRWLCRLAAAAVHRPRFLRRDR